jgi:O-acetyl-ADP-ribose deacetylase (regulator of RNase III)
VELRLILADITALQVDAIVNAANHQLLSGGGVCGAIHRAAGPELARACAGWVRQHGPVPTGGAAVTPGFALPARYVVHAVGPMWSGGDAGEGDLLAAAYANSIAAADALGDVAGIAFPSISTGIFGYPVELAAPIALRTVKDAVAKASCVRDVTFALFDERTLRAFRTAQERER